MTDEQTTPELTDAIIEEQEVQMTEQAAQVEKPKRQAKKKKEEPAQAELNIEVEPVPSPELEQLRAELAAMQAEKDKLEAERNNLTETISKLQEEVKITPQKIGRAIKDMGIEPISVSRENPKAMTIEAYNSMTDAARREWQRTHRADYLAMMHNIKINNR